MGRKKSNILPEHTERRFEENNEDFPCASDEVVGKTEVEVGTLGARDR